MKPLADCRLYTFVDTAYLHGRSPAALARLLCEGGSDLIQFRAKGWPSGQVLREVQSLVAVTRDAGVGLVVNDHYDIARAVGAPFCHLGQEDFFQAGHGRIEELSPGTGPAADVQVGLSTHAPEQALRAITAGASYLGVGPVYATGTKPTAAPVTLDYVRWAARHVTIPWFAIGGIHLGNLDEVLSAGARRICVVSAILNAPDVAQACRAFRDRLESV